MSQNPLAGEYIRGILMVTLAFGVFWGMAGLAWAAGLHENLAVGFGLGFAIGFIGALLRLVGARSLSEALALSTSRSSWGGLAMILAIVGFIVWLVR